LSFEGRALTDDEKRQVLDLFSETTDLNIVCLVETDEKKEAVMEKALSQKLMELNANTGQFYKGNLRSGQKLEFDTSVILLGDVNPGASIISKGNIVILGSFKGKAHAGAAGNTNAFVLALDMQPVQIMIADVRARCSDEPKKPEKKPMKNTQIAYLEKGSLYIEDLSREVLNDILL
jgi:septum site-determining protein MinC